MTFSVEIKVLNPMWGRDFPLPQYATTGSAGLDLRACIDSPLVLAPQETRLVASGLAIHLADPSYMAMIVPRSGLGVKHGIVLSNLVAVIDSDFQGEIGLGLWNRSAVSFTIQPGDRICQLLFVPVMQANLVVVSEFSQGSVRGEGGFGSTGRQ